MKKRYEDVRTNGRLAAVFPCLWGVRGDGGELLGRRLKNIRLGRLNGVNEAAVGTAGFHLRIVLIVPLVIEAKWERA